MNQMFADMVDVCVLVYFDDILIFSKNKQEHKQHVHAVFKRLTENNFHIKHKKYRLFTDSIELLGRILSHHSIEVCPNKIEGIKDWLVPTTVRDVQSFLGLCNYFCRFISKFTHMARPLTDLACKQLEFAWSPECQQAFDALKQKLFDVPVLMVFDLTASSEVWCDASNFATLLIQQSTLDSPWQPVEYLSKHFNQAECNYQATKREFVGLIQALHIWCHYLLGRPITISTDLASLQWLISQPHLSYYQVRWLEFMSEFDLTIAHVPKKANIVMDSLLRYVNLDPATVAAVSISVESDILAALCFAQEQDSSSVFSDLKYCTIANDRSIYMHIGLVFRTLRTGGQKIVVPNNIALK